MKNNRILSSLLWLIVAFFGIAYFTTNDEEKELKAISETNSITEKASTELLKLAELEMEYIAVCLNKGDARDIYVLNVVIHHHLLLDSINGKLKWKELENTFDSLPSWRDKPSAWRDKPSNSVLNYQDYSSKKLKVVHQNLFYTLYQRFLIKQKHRFGTTGSEEFSLFSLDSTICIQFNHYEIFSAISLAPPFDSRQKYYKSFNFNNSDTVIFEVVTEFYKNQREKEKKQYRVIAKDKKGVKINSLFDYEEMIQNKYLKNEK